MLEVPPYIVKSGVSGQPIAYTWRPHKGVEIAEKNSSKKVEQLAQSLSLRASLSLGIGIGEWLLWRLEAVSAYPQVFQYVDALWARTVDALYLKIESLDPPDDAGNPALGPLFALENLLYSVLMTATLDHPDRGKSIAQLVAVIRFTLTDPSPFDAWLRVTLERFKTNFGWDSEDPGGAFVPRAFLDPSVAIDLNRVPRLLDEQLHSIDFKGNPFLASPEEMISEGFEGTPYRYKQ